VASGKHWSLTFSITYARKEANTKPTPKNTEGLMGGPELTKSRKASKGGGEKASARTIKVRFDLIDEIPKWEGCTVIWGGESPSKGKRNFVTGKRGT